MGLQGNFKTLTIKSTDNYPKLFLRFNINTHKL